MVVGPKVWFLSFLSLIGGMREPNSFILPMNKLTKAYICSSNGLFFSLPAVFNKGHSSHYLLLTTTVITSIKDPLSKYTWVLWTTGFVPTATQSNYKIVVRATDKTGQVQTAEVRPPFPDGATGYHIINV